jgi:hypothetical protein
MNTIEQNDAQHNNKNVTTQHNDDLLECHYGDCHYSHCYGFPRYFSE